MTKLPKWTVTTNLVSPESDQYVGTSWEFFSDEGHASLCYQRHKAAGNCPCIRPYNHTADNKYMGVVHRVATDNQRAASAPTVA